MVIDYRSSTNHIFKQMTMVEHLSELRRRLGVSIVCLAVGTAVGWQFVPTMLQSFAQDVGRTFVFVSPAEGFTTHLKLSLLAGIFLAAPVFLTQTWYFIVPALFPHEQNLLRKYIVPSLLLFVGGITFAYFTVYPLALLFLLGFDTTQLQPVLAIARFVSFLFSVTLPFGFVFQFPIMLLLLVRLNVVTVRQLHVLRRVAYVAAFAVGALLTPPDAASQVLMAVPIILLYEFMLWRLRKGDVRAGH